MTITTKLAASLSVSSRNSIDLGSSSATRALSLAVELANGTGAGQADVAWTDTRTLAASGTEDLDLAGSLADPFGVSQVFARVKALVVIAAVGNTNLVQVTRPASNGAPLFMAAGDGIALRPGELLALMCGSADATGHLVTASTGDLITVTNSAGSTSVTYSIAIVGCSA